MEKISLKVRLSDIPANGLKIVSTLPLEPLNARMDEGRNNDIYFKVPPAIDLTVLKTLSGAEIKGVMRATCQQPCGRCLKSLENELKIRTDYILKPATAQEADDDLGILYYEGEHIDLEDILQESLILSITPYLQPETDESGNCNLCGENVLKTFNEQDKGDTRMGSLLKGAGIKKH